MTNHLLSNQKFSHFLTNKSQTQESMKQMRVGKPVRSETIVATNDGTRIRITTKKNLRRNSVFHN